METMETMDVGVQMFPDVVDLFGPDDGDSGGKPEITKVHQGPDSSSSPSLSIKPIICLMDTKTF